MSYGFIRKMSPAARADRERRRKARRLKHIQIDEVSSVDRGAGHGVEVRLIKRDAGHEERKPTMQMSQTSPGANEFSIAKSLFNAAQEGRLSEYDLSIAMREFARVYHDGSMAKFLDTELGKIFLAPRTMRKSYAEESELLAKRSRVDASGYGRQYAPGQNGDGMDQVDWSNDVEATKAYRAEKARKARDGSHESENARGRREVSGASINGGKISP
jgi:hypothetical protein